jgi:hypothetical protein
VWVGDRIRIEQDALDFIEKRLAGERERIRDQLGIQFQPSWGRRLRNLVRGGRRPSGADGLTP